MSDTEEPFQAPLLDELIDGMLTGKYVVFIFPGFWTFMSVCFAVGMGSMLLLVVVLPNFVSSSAIAARSNVELMGVGAAIVLTWVPLLSGFAGWTWALPWTRRTTNVLFYASALGNVLAYQEVLCGEPAGYLISLAAASYAYFGVRTVAYFSFVMFRQRLPVRRAALMRRIREGK